MLALVFRKQFGRSQLLNLHYPLLRLNFDFIDLSAKLKIDFAYSEKKLQRTRLLNMIHLEILGVEIHDRVEVILQDFMPTMFFKISI